MADSGPLNGIRKEVQGFGSDDSQGLNVLDEFTEACLSCRERRRPIDILDRFLGHDAWTTRQLLVLCLALDDQQLDREFDIGHKTVRATFLHIIYNMETWCDVMNDDQGSVIRRVGDSVPALIERLDLASAELTKIARSVAKREAWDDTFLDTFESPAERKTYGAGIAHLVTHSMHHRAQLLYMLRRLKVENLPEGDVFSWETRRI